LRRLQLQAFPVLTRTTARSELSQKFAPPEKVERQTDSRRSQRTKPGGAWRRTRGDSCGVDHHSLGSLTHTILSPQVPVVPPADHCGYVLRHRSNFSDKTRGILMAALSPTIKCLRQRHAKGRCILAIHRSQRPTVNAREMYGKSFAYGRSRRVPRRSGHRIAKHMKRAAGGSAVAQSRKWFPTNSTSGKRKCGCARSLCQQKGTSPRC